MNTLMPVTVHMGTVNRIFSAVRQLLFRMRPAGKFMVRTNAWVRSSGRYHVAEFVSFMAFSIFCSISLLAQEPPLENKESKNPYAPTPDVIERGHQFFANNCGVCHGFSGEGGERGPNLNTGQLTHGSTDADLFHTIAHGIPGTVMPANNFPADQIWAMITFLRSTVVAARAPTGGNREAGEKMFWSTWGCANCHMVKGKGGVLGPDLSQAGATRTLQYLARKVRDPSKELTKGLSEPNADYVLPVTNSTVTVVTNNGLRILGVPKNEDSFSIQVMGTDNQIHLFLKRDLKEVIHEQKSLMPAYNEKVLNEAELKNLLAYLASLE